MYYRPPMQYRQRHGFTLLEVLIAAAIFMTVMVVAVGIFGTTMSASSTSGQLRVTSQTARFVFESIARELRSAHGLVVPDGVTGKQKVIIKPFEYLSQANEDQLIIYQVHTSVKPTTGEIVYGVTRRIYRWTKTGERRLTVLIEESTSSDLTLAQISGTVSYTIKNEQAMPGFPLSAGTAMIPNDLNLIDFQVLRWVGYADDLDEQHNQPYLQFKLTVGAKAASFAGQSDKQAQTTLQTTIVPRDFSSPFEVAQSRVTGGTQ